MGIRKSKEQKVVKVKVKAFPIDALLTNGPLQTRGQIYKLIGHGCLCDTKEVLFKPGQVSELSFVLPVLNIAIKCKVLVVKVHDRLVGGGDKRTIYHYTEFHFQDLNVDHGVAISRFLKALGQRGPSE